MIVNWPWSMELSLLGFGFQGTHRVAVSFGGNHPVLPTEASVQGPRQAGQVLGTYPSG